MSLRKKSSVSNRIKLFHWSSTSKGTESNSDLATWTKNRTSWNPFKLGTVTMDKEMTSKPFRRCFSFRELSNVLYLNSVIRQDPGRSKSLRMKHNSRFHIIWYQTCESSAPSPETKQAQLSSFTQKYAIFWRVYVSINDMRPHHWGPLKGLVTMGDQATDD